MKKSTIIAALLLTGVLYGTVSAQTSGVLWIKTFSPGRTSLNDPGIDGASLAALDELMKVTDLEVTFLGSADSVGWYFDGRAVHTDISEAWNDAKRLGRARALRARYERGNVGVTHENIAGVKVVWKKRVSPDDYEMQMTRLEQENNELNQKLDKLEQDVHELHPVLAAKGQPPLTSYTINEYPSLFDWFLQGGMWSWQSASGKTLISPSLALGIIIDKTSFVLQGGVTPWHISTSEGNQAESFVYLGLKHMKTKGFGMTAGIFRGWEFFTATDNWSFKTTGFSSGIVLKYGFIEFNPALSYSSSDSIFDKEGWKVGATLGVSINFNEAF